MGCGNKYCEESFDQLIEAMTASERNFLDKIDDLQGKVDLLSITSDILRDTIERVADGTLSVEDIKKFVELARTREAENTVKASTIPVQERLDPTWPKGSN